MPWIEPWTFWKWGERSATSATLLSNTIEQIIYYIKHMEKLSPPFSPFAQPGKGVFSPCIV